ncbi:MAG TPA: hypothetical protein VE172_21440 [Stackebrandtia sp.]|uniref:hypothetical protein n=1 Tax=Stackebrandtia sp. TaxID=2023065 RepID=UPI002D277C85|nr:hypothetical protein [Stackebrandtia sp.]HZE41372.1 hypothetical protein [Stackebrandtia sp.]
MPQSRRNGSHPPVLSTAEHAAAEAAFLNGGTAVLDKPTGRVSADVITVPDSPASLWTSVSRQRYTVDLDDAVPAALRDWVAPAIVVRAFR